MPLDDNQRAGLCQHLLVLTPGGPGGRGAVVAFLFCDSTIPWLLRLGERGVEIAKLTGGELCEPDGRILGARAELEQIPMQVMWVELQDVALSLSPLCEYCRSSPSHYVCSALRVAALVREVPSALSRQLDRLSLLLNSTASALADARSEEPDQVYTWHLSSLRAWRSHYKLAGLGPKLALPCRGGGLPAEQSRLLCHLAIACTAVSVVRRQQGKRTDAFLPSKVR